MWNIVSVDASETACVIENLTPETSYQIKIKAVAEEGSSYSSSDYSDEVTAVTAAIQVLESVVISGDVATGATLTATVSPEDATVTWQWYRATSLEDEAWLAIDNANDASYTITADDLGYYFKIVATGYGDYDGVVEATTEEATIQTLDAPENIAVTDVTTTTISVEWDVVENASGYQLAYLADGGSDWIEIALDADAVSYTLTGLTPDTSYQLKVQALGDNELYLDSDYSDAITATTNALTQLEKVVLSGTYAVGEAITATVTPENADVDYQWLRAESSDANEWTVIDGAQDADYTLTAADLGMYVKVVVTASGEYTGEVEAITDVVYTTLDAPTGLTAVATSDTTIYVSWDAVENASAYQLKYKLTDDEDVATAWDSVTILNGATSLTVDELDAETSYDFKVMAFGDSVVYMNSDYSDVVSATTEEAPGPTLTQIVLSGTKTVGNYLFTTLTPSDATATYAWYRGDGENWTQIDDADAVRYKLAEDDFGLYVKVVATGSGEYSGEVEAVTTKAIMKTIGTVTLSGKTYEGETLTATLSADGAQENATYAWYRGDGETWIKISGATEQTYELTADDVGSYIMVKATGVNGYTNSASAVTDTLIEGALTVDAVVIKGTRAVDARLYAYVTPEDADVTYQWYRGKDDEWTAIDGATSYYYKQTLEDFGYYIKVVATGVGEYSGEAEAATTKATMILIGDAEIVGDLYVGNTLTVTLSADGAEENATYSWYRGDGEEWTKISGETAQTYVLTEADLGYYIKARAVGVNGYTNSAEAVSDGVIEYGTQLASVSVVGTRAVGAYLTATVAPEEATVTYQWYRGADDEWTAIDGATSRLYQQTDDDFGYYVKVVATGTGEYTGSVEASTTKTTKRLIGTASIEGDLYVGKIVTVELSTDGAAENATYSWYRGDGETWTKIAGAASQTYTLTDADLGYYVKARAVGKNGYTNSAEAVSATVVAQPTLLDSVTISGSRLVGAYLVATVAPEEVGATFQWYRGDGEQWDAIDGATSRVYTQTDDDFGYYIKVVATGAGEYGGDVEAVTAKKTMKSVGTATITGDLYVSKTVTVELTTEGAADVSTVSWYRGDGETWTKISGASGSSYELTDADLGYYIKARVVGANGYTSSAEVVTDAVIAEPTWLESVSIAGTRLVGAYLIATVAPEDADVSYQWHRGDGEEWNAINGATSRVYTQTEDDFGAYLRVVATGEGEFGGSVEATTSKTTMKTVGTATLTGSAVVGGELTVTLSAEGAAESATYSWYRGDGQTWTKIAGASSATYTLTAADAGYYVKARAVGKSGYTSSAEATTEEVVAQANSNALLDLALTQILDDELGFDL